MYGLAAEMPRPVPGTAFVCEFARLVGAGVAATDIIGQANTDLIDLL